MYLLVSLSIEMGILAQFFLRLAFGLASGMAITSPRQVSSGFFRNHLYLTLGLTTLAALVLAALSPPAMWLAVAAAILSYVGSVTWLYESDRLGMVMLLLVAACSAAAAVLCSPSGTSIEPVALWHSVSIITSSAVLGFTMAAMLLGHWYLNAPGMELVPLRRLLALAAIAIVAHSLVVGAGTAAEIVTRWNVTVAWLLFVVLRWSFGLIGVLALLWMARRTLDIPNTQSATGILYVAVLGVFVGELTGLLLSAESAYPL